MNFSKINSQILSEFNLSKSSLLSFETNIIIWSIMNDIKYLDFINGFFTSKKDYMIEEDIYSAFKNLSLKRKISTHLSKIINLVGDIIIII